MKKSAVSLVLLGIAVLLASACVRPRLEKPPRPGSEISIVPLPLKMERQPGSFPITPATRIVFSAGDEEAGRAARFLSGRLRAAFGLDLVISDAPPREGQGLILFRRSGRADLGKEGYDLSITPAAASIDAPGGNGLLYGVQTLFQLLPESVYADNGSAAGPAVLPCVRIEDKPRLPWRGLLLDVSRHFFSKDFIKDVIDDLAMHKMNTFHWHLTDDQGWRIEIKKYPRLTEVGAWRVDREDRPWNDRPPQGPADQATYGGFYTQDDVREILAYAQERAVTVVPEIEMPGHCLAALAAYPELSCSGGPFTVPPGGYWPIADVFCPGNDAVFAFLEDVLGEVIDLFPSPYIHIGGDEVDKSAWKICPKCQARMKAEGLNNEEELQSWFVKKIERFLNSKSRTLIGWDEILEGGLAPNAAVMSWRGMEGGMAAARAGHPVVMTPTSHCYIDYYQGDPALEPKAIGGFLPLGRVYAFEPVPETLSAEEARFIVGAQANLWTEYIPSPEHAQYMLFPRLAAMAEAGWTEKGLRDWDGFLGRMTKQLRRYQNRGRNYARSLYAVRVAPARDEKTGRMRLGLETESRLDGIRYTLDGTAPGWASKSYTDPFAPRSASVIKAGLFLDGALAGPVTETIFRPHRALGQTPALAAEYKKEYSGGGALALVDGLRGSQNHQDGRWQGYEGDDLEAVIDLGKAQTIRSITAGFLQDARSWIFWPREVQAALSEDGKNYRPLQGVHLESAANAPGLILKDIRIEAAGVKARYIRLSARSLGLCPPDHPGAGQKAWLFVDEIIVD